MPEAKLADKEIIEVDTYEIEQVTFSQKPGEKNGIVIVYVVGYKTPDGTFAGIKRKVATIQPDDLKELEANGGMPVELMNRWVNDLADECIEFASDKEINKGIKAPNDDDDFGLHSTE